MENTATFEEIAHAARQLPSDEKAALAEMLLEELGSGQFATKEIEAAWIEEAERRWDAYQRGEMSSSPSEEVFARVRERIQHTRG
jgi:putative addiction module component (TIGR02574 family)